MFTRYKGTESILLVDDEPVVLNLARSILNMCGYTVKDFKDPQAAIKECRSMPFDLVLTDVVMPNINGPDMVREIKTEQPGVRCIFMSGYDLDQIARRGIEPQCDYLQKPFTPEGLLRRVRSTLGEKLPPG